MSIYFGNDTVKDLYVGLTPVTKGYVGTHLFYNGDNTIIDTTYEKYILNTQCSTLYNTAEKPVKSAILKGNTKYHDIDTGDILDTFDETKNLELVSVKMPVLKTTGKNLFDVSYYVQGVEEKLCYSQNGDKLQINALDNRSEMMHVVYKIKKGETLTLSTNPKLPIRIYLINRNYMITDTPTYTAREDCEIGLKFVAHEYPTLVEVQLEKGSTATSYEPYKSNILTVNEEIELRGVGDIKDEFDSMTGEVTRKIGKIVLDGGEDENWGISSNTNDTTACFYWTDSNLFDPHDVPINTPSKVICDRFPYSDSAGTSSITYEAINHIYNSLRICIKVSKLEDVSVASFRKWLSANPTTVYYKLPVGPTMELVTPNITDQDGNNTKLNTFNDTTHVTLSSEGVIPEAELEVATKS